MGKRGKKRADAIPYETIARINKLSKDELTREFLREENDINALREKQKSAKKFKAEEKREEKESMSLESKKAIEEIDEKIEALKDEKKELKDGTREGEIEEDKKAVSGAAKELNKEVKERLALRNYLYNQLNVAYGVQMTVKA